MKKILLTIGHNVKDVDTLTTETICASVTQTLNIIGFTAIPCCGMWQGMAEKSTRIEIVAEDFEAEAIVSAIPTLCADLKQDAIMCEIVARDVTFVTPQDLADIA